MSENEHFIATAKSECIKNAASDLGEYYGRGLNEDLKITRAVKEMNQSIKPTPDSKIMQQFADAIIAGDTATQTLLSNMYNIKND